MQANKSALRAPRALCCLTLSNPIRMAALALVEWKYPFVWSLHRACSWVSVRLEEPRKRHTAASSEVHRAVFCFFFSS